MKRIDLSHRQLACIWKLYEDYFWLFIGIVGISAGALFWHFATQSDEKQAQLHIQMTHEKKALSLHQSRLKRRSQRGDALSAIIAECDNYHVKLLDAEEKAPTEIGAWRQNPIKLTLETDYLTLIELLATWESGTPWREVRLIQAKSLSGGNRTQATVDIISYSLTDESLLYAKTKKDQ